MGWPVPDLRSVPPAGATAAKPHAVIGHVSCLPPTAGRLTACACCSARSAGCALLPSLAASLVSAVWNVEVCVCSHRVPPLPRMRELTTGCNLLTLGRPSVGAQRKRKKVRNYSAVHHVQATVPSVCQWVPGFPFLYATRGFLAPSLSVELQVETGVLPSPVHLRSVGRALQSGRSRVHQRAPVTHYTLTCLRPHAEGPSSASAMRAARRTPTKRGAVVTPGKPPLHQILDARLSLPRLPGRCALVSRSVASGQSLPPKPVRHLWTRASQDGLQRDVLACPKIRKVTDHVGVSN